MSLGLVLLLLLFFRRVVPDGGQQAQLPRPILGEPGPIDLERDLHLLESVDVDLVWTPTPEMMYPTGYQTWVEVQDVSRGLEGAQRPGHFRGVRILECNSQSASSVT